MGIQIPTKDVYTISGTGFSMEIKMPTKNISNIGHSIKYGDETAHSEDV
jgi:hypothetical protein